MPTSSRLSIRYTSGSRLRTLASVSRSLGVRTVPCNKAMSLLRYTLIPWPASMPRARAIDVMRSDKSGEKEYGCGRPDRTEAVRNLPRCGVTFVEATTGFTPCWAAPNSYLLPQCQDLYPAKRRRCRACRRWSGRPKDGGIYEIARHHLARPCIKFVSGIGAVLIVVLLISGGIFPAACAEKAENGVVTW